MSNKASRATLVGGNSDGRNLYLEVEVFDGEHNNRFEPVFPLNTSAEDVTNYLKDIIEKNAKLPDDVMGLMQKTVFWDAAENGWYTQVGSQKPVRMDERKSDHLSKR